MRVSNTRTTVRPWVKAQWSIAFRAVFHRVGFANARIATMPTRSVRKRMLGAWPGLILAAITALGLPRTEFGQRAASSVTSGSAPAQNLSVAQPSQSDLGEMSLDDLMKIKVQEVYSASKYIQKVTDAPSSVTIITSDEIRKHGYRTLADILRSVRGFYVTYDRNYSYVGARGLLRPGDYNSRILLLVDGHRMNEPVYDLVYIGRESPIDVDLIDRVEVIRGPSSSIYGTNAFFAVINVITKTSAAMKGLEVSGELASFGTQAGRLSYSHRFNNSVEMLLSGSLYGSQGQQRLFFQKFDSPANNNGIAQNADYEQLE